MFRRRFCIYTCLDYSIHKDWAHSLQVLHFSFIILRPKFQPVVTAACFLLVAELPTVAISITGTFLLKSRQAVTSRLTDDRSTDDSDGGGISVVLDLCFRVMFYYHIRSPLCHEVQQWEYRGVSFWSKHHCQAPQRTPRPEMFLDVGQFFVDKRWMSFVVHPTMRSISPFWFWCVFLIDVQLVQQEHVVVNFLTTLMGCYGFCLIFALCVFCFSTRIYWRNARKLGIFVTWIRWYFPCWDI